MSTAERSRVLPFEGGCNFRDIGGYVAAGGTTVHLKRKKTVNCVLSVFGRNCSHGTAIATEGWNSASYLSVMVDSSGTWFAPC